MKTPMYNGQVVVCQDHQNVEHLVEKNQFYIVREVSHRGAIVQLEGVALPLASTRFSPVRTMPPNQELVIHES